MLSDDAGQFNVAGTPCAGGMVWRGIYRIDGFGDCRPAAVAHAEPRRPGQKL